MQKYSKHIFFSLVLFFCCIELLGMEQILDQKKVVILLSAPDLPLDTINKIFLDCEIQSIGRFGSTNKVYNNCYKQFIICQTPDQDDCKTFGCSFFRNNFDACTKILSHYAKKYYSAKKYQENCAAKDKEQEEYITKEIDNYFCMFKHLWGDDNQFRDKGVRDVIGIENPTWQDRIKVYAGDCYNREQKKIINSFTLKRFLYEKNISAIKTILLDEHGFVEINTNDWELLKWRLQLYSGNDSLLDCVCKLGKIDVIEKLINDCSGKDTFDRSFLKVIGCAMKHQKGELVTDLIKKDFKISNENRFNIFDLALQYGCQIIEVIKLLFLDDINVMDKDGRSLLYFAVSRKNVDVTRFLLEKGANNDVVYKQKTILDCILKDRFSEKQQSRVDILKVLFEYGVNINEIDAAGRTLLMKIALQNSWSPDLEEIGYWLIKSGIKIDAVDNDGKTALHHHAALFTNSNIGIIKELIKQGINILVIDNEGKTALHYACIDYFGNDIDKIKILLDAGSDINACDNNGNTALLCCDMKLSLIKFLLKNGAKVSIVNKDKQGFFHHIAKHRLSIWDQLEAYKEVCEQILKAGINIHAVDIDGNTPLMIARDNNNESIVRLLTILEKSDKDSPVTNNFEKTDDSKQKINDFKVKLNDIKNDGYDFQKKYKKFLVFTISLLTCCLMLYYYDFIPGFI